MTVKASGSIGPAILACRVVTGKNFGIGNTGTSIAFPEISFTAQQNNSLVYGANVSCVTFESGASWPLWTGFDSHTTVLEQNMVGGRLTTPFSVGAVFKAAGSTTARNLGLGAAGSGSPILSYTGLATCLCEITGSSLAEDASTPATVPADNSESDWPSVPLTGPAFQPPYSALLVAIVAGELSAGSISDTSSLGLTWTERVQQSGPTQSGFFPDTGNVSVWTAPLPAAPAAAANVSAGVYAPSVYAAVGGS